MRSLSPTALDYLSTSSVSRWLVTVYALGCMLTMSNASIAWAAQDDKESSDIATADASLSQAPSNAPRDVYMVLAGGASLGSYEAGYVATFVQFLRENSGRFHLKGISGTSAGSINSFASALEFCRSVEENTPKSAEPDSIPYAAWMPIDWLMIYDKDKVSTKAMFHTDGLIAHGIEILRAKGVAFRPGCKVPIRVAVTREMDRPEHAQPTDTLTMIEYIGVELRISSQGEPQYFQLPIRVDDLPHQVTLVAEKDGRINLANVMQMMAASAAFPMAFPPVNMDVMTFLPNQEDAGPVTTARMYYDGGIFDNVPLRSIFRNIEDESTRAPLVVVIDLQDQRLPETVRELGANNDGLSNMTQTWMHYARSRAYADTVHLLSGEDIQTLRAHQRYPTASGFLAAFAGFLDLSFRKTDYLLGEYDARQDLLRTAGIAPDALPASSAQTTCLQQLLDGKTTDSCDTNALPDNIIATLRGLVAAGNVRCESLAIPSMGCASFVEEKLDQRLWRPEQRAGQIRRKKRHTQESPQQDFAAFLQELALGDFVPSLKEDWTELSQHLSRNPARLYTRVIEDGLHEFAKKQATSTIRAALAFDAILQSALPISPRTSLSTLISLHSIEATVNVPISMRLSMDAGGTAEWGISPDRRKKWHLVSGGPVVRFGVNLSKSQTTFALFADMHAGILFGPTFDNVVIHHNGVGFSRSKTIPHAAVFVGIAPRIFILRRLQLDLPVRAYWLCANAACTSFVDKKPSYGIALRVGWNWTTSAKVR